MPLATERHIADISEYSPPHITPQRRGDSEATEAREGMKAFWVKIAKYSILLTLP